ncbi:MAG: TOTE conflict system archaeo-eukaryotic primase domain-containing protein [Solirubrobacteraceae bacterium]
MSHFSASVSAPGYPSGCTSAARSQAAEVRLRELDRQREATALASCSEAVMAAPGESSLWTPERKLALFASLFRGREDVFTLRWEKPANGRSGWAPCCENE